MKNEMKLSMDAISENEALGRICIATFLTRLHPTLEELEDVKTAVSEAITNAIIHGVPADGKVYITCRNYQYNNLSINNYLSFFFALFYHLLQQYSCQM